MRTISLIAVLSVTICISGCENAELTTCQQEKNVLQEQLDQANTAIKAKDGQIEKLKAESTEMQTKAMESVMTILQKEAARDKEQKQALIDKTQEIKTLKGEISSLKATISGHKCPVPEASVETPTLDAAGAAKAVE